MRTLGVDHGSVRVGLALSDELGMLALPLETVESRQAILRIREVVLEKNVGIIVVGMPRNMNGSYGPKAEEVRLFIEKLKSAVNIEVRSWDERMTTLAAERSLIEANVSRKRRKEVIDQAAAQQILQGFLDSQSCN